MTKNTSIAKIASPVPGDILERERLYSLLDKRYPVSWISSPGGSGKTTLTASYLRARNIPHIWYRLDSGDGDIATFFHYLGLAAKKAAPRRKKELPHLGPEFMMGILTFTKRFFEELYSRLKPPAVIVFDDYQEVSTQSDFHEVLNSGLSVLPDGISVIIMSRVNPPEAFSRLQLNRRMTVIGWESLRLDIEETAGIGHLINPSAIESHIPEVLYQKTGGWMAGLILMLESVHMEKFSTISINDDISEVIFGYFETEIFYGLDEEIRLFLLKTASMPSMTSEMAKKITGLKQARHILSDLYGKNCFVEKRLQNPPVYQYHPLFRAFLLKKTDEHFSEEEKDQLLKYVARLLSQSGQVEEAAEILLETGDLEQLIPLILENAQPFVLQGRSRIVEAWIQAVPEPVREENPWLIFWLGSCKMAYNMVEVRPLFKKSLKLLDRRNDSTGAFLSWCGVAESMLWGWDDYKSFDGWIDVLNNLVKKYKGIPEGEIGDRISIAMFSALTFYYPDHPQFELWKGRALSLQGSNHNLSCRMTALVHYATYLQVCGKLKEADEVLLSIKSLVQSSNPSCLELMQAQLAETIQANFTGDLKRCLKATDKSLEISNRNGIHIIDVMIVGHAMWSSLKYQDYERADYYMKVIESSLSVISPFERSFYHFLKAYFAIHKKDIPLAEKESRRSMEVILNIGVLPPRITLFPLYVYALHEMGKYEEALTALSEAFNISLRFDKKGYIFELSLLEAYFAFHRGDEVIGFKALKAGLAQGRERGYKEALFFSLPEVNRNLYAKALSAGIEVEYVQQLIRNNALLPPEGKTDLENWPWPIKVYTLGTFRIEVDGTPLKEGRKAHHRLFNLLSALICLGGSNVPSYRLADILWPDQDGDAAQSALDMGIHRLRKLLNYPEAIEVRHGSVSLNRKVCWVDAIAFDEQVRHLKERGPGNKAYPTAEIENILSMYKGKLLPALADIEWTWPMRENLGKGYLKILEKLGNKLEESKKWGDALEIYSRGVEDNPLSEEHVRGLMRTCKLLGRPVEAILAYQKFEENLKNTMGIDPSTVTKTLLKEIS